jgi:hypothetical protein
MNIPDPTGFKVTYWGPSLVRVEAAIEAVCEPPARSTTPADGGRTRSPQEGPIAPAPTPPPTTSAADGALPPT